MLDLQGQNSLRVSSALRPPPGSLAPSPCSWSRGAPLLGLRPARALPGTLCARCGSVGAGPSLRALLCLEVAGWTRVQKMGSCHLLSLYSSGVPRAALCLPVPCCSATWVRHLAHLLQVQLGDSSSMDSATPRLFKELLCSLEWPGSVAPCAVLSASCCVEGLQAPRALAYPTVLSRSCGLCSWTGKMGSDPTLAPQSLRPVARTAPCPVWTLSYLSWPCSLPSAPLAQATRAQLLLSPAWWRTCLSPPVTRAQCGPVPAAPGPPGIPVMATHVAAALRGARHCPASMSQRS